MEGDKAGAKRRLSLRIAASFLVVMGRGCG